MSQDEFILAEDGAHAHDGLLEIGPRWRELALAGELSRAFILLAGESLHGPAMVAGEEGLVWLKVGPGLPQISADGLDVELWLQAGGGMRRLLCWHLANGDVEKQELAVPLPLPAGTPYRLVLRCGAGPQGDPSADWLAVLEWVAGPAGRLSLLRARCHGDWRMHNEVAHFSGAYDRDFYAGRRIERSDGGGAAGIRRLPADASHIPAIDGAALARDLGDPAPIPGENTFEYAHRLLGLLLPLPAPDFAARLRERQQLRAGQPLRMLSLCAGEAAVEGMLLEQAGVPVRLCLVDVNEGLLERASRRMPANVEVDRVLASVNDIGPGLGRFDLVNITSGLHHLVELERVLAAIAAMLAPGGEFWLVGEQVGRNGNRLWPDALRAADAVFSAWPDDKRRNAGTGRIDARLPRTDFASACFEGIRSQDIEELLGRYFLPVDVHLRDAFLWRLVDPAYAGNFDLSDAGDRRLLREAAVAEAVHWLEGGRGTSLNGVFRPKRGLVAAATP